MTELTDGRGWHELTRDGIGVDRVGFPGGVPEGDCPACGGELTASEDTPGVHCRTCGWEQ